MLGKQAKIINPVDTRRILTTVGKSKFPLRNRAIVLLSLRAGLRACEIANLTWAMVTTPKGDIAQTIDVRSFIAKKGSGRRLPLHPELRETLAALKRLSVRVFDYSPDNPIIQSHRGAKMRANSIVNWFISLYRDLELIGCSSHSGRRTFITQAARNAHKAGASLRDVQLLAGHRSIETTQGYIDGDSFAQRRLVALL